MIELEWRLRRLAGRRNVVLARDALDLVERSPLGLSAPHANR